MATTKNSAQSYALSFHLKDSKSDSPTAIFAYFAHDGQRTKIYTGLKIHPSQWNTAEQRAKTRGYANNGFLNDALDLIEKKVIAFYQASKAKGLIPIDEQLRQSALPETAKEEVKPVTLWESIEEFLEIARQRNKLRSAQVYASTRNHLKNFEQIARYPVTFDSLNASFFDRFTGYLISKPKLTDTTIVKQIGTLKRFIYFSIDRGYTTNLACRKWKWKKREPKVIALTEEEVQALESLDLTTRPYLDNARNLLLIGCFTGLRFSDFTTIKPEHLRADHLRIVTYKTHDDLVIPLDTRAKRLIELYLTGKIHPITNQRLNGYLKEVAKLAGIDEATEIVRYRGGERLSKTVAKWEVVSSHIGRRTFATLSLQRGMRSEVVMAITGHTDRKSFKRYISITDTTVLKEFAKAYEVEPVLKVV